MSVLFVMTLVSLVGQTVVARLLTEVIWSKTIHPIAIGVLQCLGTAMLLIVVGWVFSGIGSVIIVVFGELIFGFEDQLLNGGPEPFTWWPLQWLFGAMMAFPYLYALWRVVKLVRAARATLAWQQGKT